MFENIGFFDDRDYSIYSISNYGLVKNSRGMILKSFDDRGYKAYMLYDGKTGKSNQMMAHRLVAHIYCKGRTRDRNTVNHIDENRSNNYYVNLEWASNSENTLHSRSKAVQQIDIKSSEIIEVYESMTAAAEKNNINIGDISKCCNGKRKTAGGYKFQFVKE